MPARYDAVVIGGGLNGLVAAAYLAKAGQRTVVLERCEAVGGSVVDAAPAVPGFVFGGCADDIGWLPPTVARELELARYGLELLSTESAVLAPLQDGGALALWGEDHARTRDSLRRLSAADAERWPAFSDRLARLAAFLETIYAAPAPQPTGTSAADLFALARLGPRVRALGKTEMIELLRIVPMPVAELLDDSFECDALKGAVGSRGVTGILQGPRSGGTAFVLLHHHVGNPSGAFHAHTQVRGGAGKLAAALAAAARAAGAELRCGSEVIRILVDDARATGVALADGTEIAARRVVSSAEPRQTFLRLTGPTYLDPEFVRAVGSIKYRGARARVNLALGELPRFRGVDGDAEAMRGTISVAPSLDYLERAYDDAKYGRVSRAPHLTATIPSMIDPSRCPPGTHVMSVNVQYAPYRLRDGAWNDATREALGDATIATLAQYAPNLPGAILRRQVLTPLDIEQSYGLAEGSVDQGELTLDQILFMRPVAGWARYRTPIENLYLCGSSAHPGGRVAGGAGRLAAREVLRERRRT